jgi:phosphatidylserine/phosphatidylglycerophosphate/cardiolipin synthase-like enzyme
MSILPGKDLIGKVSAVQRLGQQMKESDLAGKTMNSIPRGTVIIAFIIIGLLMIPSMVRLGKKIGGKSDSGVSAQAVASKASGVPQSGAPARSGSVRVFYAPGTDLEKIDIQLISGARRSLDADFYTLTDEGICDSLVADAKRGVAIRVYEDPSQLREVSGDRECRDELRQAGIPVKVKASGDLMHLKSYLVDGYLLRTGSANASKSGERFQDNDLVVISDRAAADGFKANFEMLWNRPGNSD